MTKIGRPRPGRRRIPGLGYAPGLLLAWLVIVAAVLQPACANDYALVTLRGDEFSIVMPRDPERSESSVMSEVGALRVVEYESRDPDKAFAISYADAPFGKRRGALDGVIAQSAAPDGTVHEETATTYQGFETRDARITGPDFRSSPGSAGSKGTQFIRIIQVEDRRYVLEFIADGDNVKQPPAAYLEIRDSLKID